MNSKYLVLFLMYVWLQCLFICLESVEFSFNCYPSWGYWFCCFFFFPISTWNVLIFQAHPVFKMLLSICISYMFQVICPISYLVFKLEVVVMAGCQMFRLSCLQHILMWIYWWTRRKFLIKSTVQNTTCLLWWSVK